MFNFPRNIRQQTALEIQACDRPVVFRHHRLLFDGQRNTTPADLNGTGAKGGAVCRPPE